MPPKAVPGATGAPCLSVETALQQPMDLAAGARPRKKRQAAPKREGDAEYPWITTTCCGPHVLSLLLKRGAALQQEREHVRAAARRRDPRVLGIALAFRRGLALLARPCARREVHRLLQGRLDRQARRASRTWHRLGRHFGGVVVLLYWRPTAAGNTKTDRNSYSSGIRTYSHEFTFGGGYAYNSRIDMAPLTNSACRVKREV